ncbi:MAG: dihydrofolate reductase, partial [Asticcacaulis sp.]
MIPKVRLSLVVAMSENGVIGREGALPWHLRSDLALFKRITHSKPI